MAQLIRSVGFPLKKYVYNVLIRSLSSVYPKYTLVIYQPMLVSNQTPISLTLLGLV